MNKREFLAVGGAVPLMLAGCGGSGSGSAPVRLVNASVGYPALGFMVESTQETTSDIAYGSASQFINVQAGAVGVTLTTGTPPTSVTTEQTRTIQKGVRYSLVAYGFADELKFSLITESTTTPDAGKANINVLNTSVDIGAVDVYLSADKTLTNPTLIASSISANSVAPGQSGFQPTAAGSYFITVVGAGSKGLTDLRFQTNAAVALTALEVLTIILTPGASGILANAILLTQGTAAAANPTVNDPNTTARIRAVTATNGLSTTVTGVDSTSKAITILPTSTVPQFSNYFVTTTTALPTVTVGGNAVTPFMMVNGAPGTATLLAGGDYTLMVYLDSSNNPIAQIIEDNNTAPLLTQGVKYRLINLAADNQGLSLSMTVNSQVVASQVGYGTASDYTELSTPQNVTSIVKVLNGTVTVASPDPQVLGLGSIFTDVVTNVPGGNLFFAARSN
jgi:hypothetical protein